VAGSESALIEFLIKQSAGQVTDRQIVTILADKFGNQEYVTRFGIQDIVRRMQLEIEVKPTLDDFFSGAFGDHLNVSGAVAAGKIMADAILSMTKEGLNIESSRQRSAHVAQELMKQATVNSAISGLHGKSQNEIELIVVTAWATGSAYSEPEFGMSLIDVIILNDPDTISDFERR